MQVSLVKTCIDLFIETQNSLCREDLHINLYKELVSFANTCIDLFIETQDSLSREDLYRFIH